MSKMLIYEGMKPIKELEAHRLWGRLLQRYTRTNLTKSEDRLIALAGLASRMALFTKSTYVAGLWRNNLASNLLWKSKSLSRPFPIDYLAPTFSWASVDSPVEMVELLEDAEPDEWAPTVEVVEVHIHLKSQSGPFGQVTGGYLRLKGIVRPAELQFGKGGKITAKIEGIKQTRGISVLPDGKLTSTEIFDTVPTVTRLRSRPLERSHSRSSISSLSAFTDVSSDISSMSENDEDDTDDTDEDEDETDEDDTESDDSDLEDDEDSDGSGSDVYNLSDDDESSDDSSSSGQNGRKLSSAPVHLLHLGFLSVEKFTSYCLILGHSPTQKDSYERLGLLKWRHDRGWRDGERIKRLPKSEIIIV
jgi:hypothetical protein